MADDIYYEDRESEAERDALAAKLAELEGQEPAYFVDEQGLPRKYTSRDFNQCNYGGLQRLYARPVPRRARECAAAGGAALLRGGPALFDKYGQMCDSSDWDMFAAAVETAVLAKNGLEAAE